MGKKKTPKCLVIDADIARAAGGDKTKDDRAKNCRDFMNAVLETTHHKVVLTETIRAEWNKHQSTSTLTWRRTMIAQKRVCFIKNPVDDGLRLKVEQCSATENKRKAMLKDIHLIEAAFQADRIVLSMDEIVRLCFHEITSNIRRLRFITWVNPSKSEETPIHWLQNGANLERERLLGYRKEDSNT